MTDTPPLGPLPEPILTAMSAFAIGCAYGPHSDRMASAEALDAAIRAYALQERAAVQQWRPIETAPREDGTHVLLHGNGEDFEDCTVVGWWCGDRRRWMPFDGFARLMPTHWMPLPPPPQRADPGKDAA